MPADVGSWWQLIDDRLAAVFTQDGIWRAAGSACTAILGWTPDELVGRPLSALLHADDLDALTKALRAAAEGRDRATVQLRLRHKDGTHRRIDWHLVASADRIDAVGQETAPYRPAGRGDPESPLRQALAENTALLQTTLETMDQGLIMFDADQRIHVYNKRALDLLELPEALMQERPTLRRLIDYQLARDDFARSDAALRQWVVDSGVRVTRDVYERVRPNGTVLEIRTVPLAGGGAVRTYTDITARRLAEQERNAGEERYRALIAAGTAIVWTAAPDGRIVHAEGWADYSGQSAEEYVGEGWLERVHADDRPAVVERWRAIVDSGAPGALEYRVCRQDGAIRWVQARAVPLIGLDGQIREWVGTLVDIHERRGAQQTLAESEARYRLLAESLTDMIVRTDPSGLRTYVSPASRDLLGYRPEELVGTRAVDFAHPEDRDELAANLAAIGDGKVDRVTSRYRLRHKSGHWVPIESTLRGVRSTAGEIEGIISVSRDVTDRQRLEAQIHQAQRMEAMGQLTGGIAHDFNNLLTVVIGNAELLVEEPGDAAMTHELATMILDTAERGAELASRLLAFGRRQSLRPQRICLSDAVKNMLPIIRRSAGEHIDVVTDLRPGNLLALTDRALLESALLNLVVNARDAMPQRGTLTITTGQGVAGLGEGQLPFGQPVVSLSVSDTGTGMPPEVLARAFEPFFTTKDVGKGTGLGLSMVYGFAHQSGGHVSIESRQGFGTSVTILLPGITGTRAAESVTIAGPLPRAAQERVLLVEDEPKVLQFVSAQLANLGYDVTAVSSGPDALDLLGQGETFDLLFSDVVLPKGMSGVELARRARAMRPDLKVLLASGYSEESFKHHGRPEEGTILLRKPYRRKELAETIRKVLNDT